MSGANLAVVESPAGTLAGQRVRGDETGAHRLDDFEGRVAVVTGAVSGIGLAYAAVLGELGMHLVLADIEADALQRAAAAMSDRARSVLTVVTDVSDADSVQRLADRCFATHGSVHLLCNNAGVSATRSLLDASVDDWRVVVERQSGPRDQTEDERREAHDHAASEHHVAAADPLAHGAHCTPAQHGYPPCAA